MSTITYIVKVASGKFTIDDAVAPKLTFRDGDTYVFDQSDNSNSGHILQFSATSNNSGSSEYTTGVTKTGTAGSSGAKTTIVTSGSTTDTLYYYSSGGGDHGSEFSNSGFKTSSNFNFLKPIVGASSTAEKWGSMVNHAIDQIDQNISGQDLDGATDSGTVAVDLDTQSLTVAGSNGIATSGSGQTITISGEALAYQGEPHIIPDVLYPAVAGKLLDGSTSHSGNYGTAQSDGRMYYYTDIKGSKPIKDPRIGAYFGSQRHMFKSMQLLEQETATHGKEVHSVDGREWIRTVEGNSNKWYTENGNSGVILNVDDNATGMFFEVTGYFNDINLIGYTSSDRANDVDITVNGDSASRVDGGTTFDTTVGSPLVSRYVSAGSVINLGGKTALGSSTLKAELGTAPAINTVKIEYMAASIYDRLTGIELIAQDTTSTANRSKIQIPSQNVVSYGKKFTVSGTPHYDPFNGFTSGNLAAVQALIDTDTSLGMANWLSSSTYYRPFNGGRVVKWVDSSGNIKTSVTMMPPNAQNIAGSASNAHTLGNANDQTINFDTTTIANATPLSEVAKTFHWREFGNGAANGGTGGTYADASMLNTSDDIAYVMDDGLTSLSGDDCRIAGTTDFVGDASGDIWYMTFIGTGITLKSVQDSAGTDHFAQNLPYGTHVLKVARDGTANATYTIDGVSLGAPSIGTYGGFYDCTFHQPQKPPIPEDAVVLADYMLMADFVGVSTSSGGIEVISKGTRWVSPSRDYFYDENCSTTLSMTNQSSGIFTIGGFYMGVADYYNDSPTQAPYAQLPYFGTTVDCRTYADRFSAITEPINSTSLTTTSVSTTTWSGRQRVTGQTLGLNGCRTTGHTSGGGSEGGANQNNFNHMGFEIHTPIHTSSHYQSFETPFLKELVGGDRNMEQTNLIVTPDGKTWDEVTRDTSYIGNHVICTTTDTETDYPSYAIFDEWRGTGDGSNYFNKDFAIAYDRLICLKAGQYKFTAQGRTSGTTEHTAWIAHGTSEFTGYIHYTDQLFNIQLTTTLKRGDVVQLQGEFGVSLKNYNQIAVERV